MISLPGGPASLCRRVLAFRIQGTRRGHASSQGAILVEALVASMVAAVTVTALLSLGSQIQTVSHLAFERAAFASEALGVSEKILDALKSGGQHDRSIPRDFVTIGKKVCPVSIGFSREAAPGLVIPGFVRTMVEISSPDGVHRVARSRLMQQKMELLTAGKLATAAAKTGAAALDPEKSANQAADGTAARSTNDAVARITNETVSWVANDAAVPAAGGAGAR